MAYPLIVTRLLSWTEHRPTRIKVSCRESSATYGIDGLSDGKGERAVDPQSFDHQQQSEGELVGRRAVERFLVDKLPDWHADPHTLVACYDDTTCNYMFLYKTVKPVITQQGAGRSLAIVGILDDMTRQEVRTAIRECKDISDDAATRTTTAYTYKLFARLLRQQLKRFATDS